MPQYGAAAPPPVDLERAIRSFISTPTRPDRSRVNYASGTNSSGKEKNTEGGDVPLLEWSASCRPETVTLGSLGYRLKVDDTDEDPDVFQLEEHRLTHTERIISSVDGESYVDVEVIDQIDFKNLETLVRKFVLKALGRGA